MSNLDDNRHMQDASHGARQETTAEVLAGARLPPLPTSLAGPKPIAPPPGASDQAGGLYSDELVHLAQSLHRLALATLRREQDLQDANRHKSRLLAIVERDLRQPLEALRASLRHLNARQTGVAAIRHVAGAQTALARLEQCVRLFSDAACRELAGLDRPPALPPILPADPDPDAAAAWRRLGARRVASLTAREREIMDLVVAGHANKKIAARIGISQRTVEKHRAALMKKIGAGSLADLIRMVMLTEDIACRAAGAGPADWTRGWPDQPRPHVQP